MISRHLARRLVVKAIADVTGEPPDEVEAQAIHLLDTRDWEQVVSRIEAYFDVSLGLLASPDRVVDIGALADRIVGIAAVPSRSPRPQHDA